MDKNQLIAQLKVLGVMPVDIDRAAIYLEYLTDAHTYFTQTLNDTLPNGGIGAAAFQFAQTALGSGELLNELAEILDLFVGEALNADLKRVFQAKPGYTYDAYFTNTIYTKGPNPYPQNVTVFFNRYAVARHALDQAALNFKSNIKQACERAYADRPVLARLYHTKFPNNLNFNNLTAIKSTGSDFHKGGKQVLILSFQISHQVQPDHGNAFTKQEMLKVVYKPSDLEADCVLAGQATAVNRALRPVNNNNDFMAESLFEIYNSELAGNANLTGHPLPTYLILPRIWQSGQAPNYQIREAYGYLEFLDNDVSTPWGEVWGWYPWATSDFIIFSSETPGPITSKFYQIEGAFAAVASTFSMIDLHVENVRVMARTPMLIDMEICLTEPVTNAVETTSLLGNLGGITGIRVNAQDFKWGVVSGNVPGKAYLKKVHEDQIKQNRLWFSQKNRQRRLVPVDAPEVLQGFDDGIEILRTLVQDAHHENRLTNWMARLNNVVVRVLPYATSVLRNLLMDMFANSVPYESQPHLTVAQTVDRFLLIKRTLEYQAYPAGQNPAVVPEFLVLTDAVSGLDYTSLDVPIFYHRIGTSDIVDSRGVVVPIPATIPIIAGDNPNAPPQNAQVTGPAGVFNRATYYDQPPFANIVQANQIAPLGAGVNAFQNRVQPLRASIQTYFQAPQHGAGTIVPFT